MRHSSRKARRRTERRAEHAAKTRSTTRAGDTLSGVPPTQRKLRNHHKSRNAAVTLKGIFPGWRCALLVKKEV